MMDTARTDAGVVAVVSGRPRLRQASWWAGKAFWAVLDQGLFAISSFILGVLLARWLAAEQFGSFALAQSVVLLVGTLYTGLIIEPMLVFGSARHTAHFAAYLDILLLIHRRLSGLAIVLCALLGTVFWFSGLGAVSGALYGVAVAAPCVTFGWLARRACYVRLQPQWAAMGGILNMVATLAGAYLLWRASLLSAFSALMLLGLAGFLSGCSILPRLQQTTTSAGTGAPSYDDVVRDHWRYGRWALASSGLSWIPSNSYYIFLPAFAGLSAAGELRAVSNVIMPILLLNDAIGTLLLPAFSRAAQATKPFKRLLALSLTAFTGSALLYGALLTAFRLPILNYLYGPAYSHTGAVVPILALVPVSVGFSAVFAAALRALEHPQYVFWAYVASTVSTVSLGLWFTARWGLVGATVGVLLSSMIHGAMCAVFLVMARRERVTGS